MNTTDTYKTPKKVLLILKPSQLQKIDHMASKESRTRSDLIREACRLYEEKFDLKQAQLTAVTYQNR